MTLNDIISHLKAGTRAFVIHTYSPSAYALQRIISSGHLKGTYYHSPLKTQTVRALKARGYLPQTIPDAQNQSK